MAGEFGNRFQVLCYEQVSRLAEVTDAPIEVHGRGNFPTLEIQLKDLVKVIQAQLKHDGIVVKDVRLNGGAASYILGCHSESSFKFNDLDLIFGLDMSSHNDLQKVKTAVLNSLLNFLPDGVNKEKMSSCSLKEAYVHKMVKVCNDTDRWSLISLFSNNKGKNVDLKFVDTMKRQFEFSVDSFQIILDSLLTFYDISPRPMSEHFYPTVVAESVFGNFNTALYHLNNKLIATRNPEEIRGGGLLKYCNLLVRDYVPAENVDIKSLERYMCSRFFIDFPDTAQQQAKLENYLASHFTDDDQMKFEYLMTLYAVVDESTICLMGHERRQTLNLIQQHASQVQLEQNQKAYNKQLQMQQFDKQNFSSSSPVYDQQSNLIIDQVYYGPYSYQIAPMGSDQYYPMYTYITPAEGSPTQCPYCPKYLQCS